MTGRPHAGATVAEALSRAEQRLRDAGVEAPRIQATALLGHVMGVERAGVLGRLRDPLPDPERARFAALVDRRARREPLQYLLGKADFLDFRLRVGPGVFIPRPETEQVVETALSAWSPDLPLAIDCCSGSGAIAVALARARPDARVVAVELSATAARVAATNARELGVGSRMRVVRGDLLGCVGPGMPPEGVRRQLGLVVCNPPYARRGDVVQPEVRDHEPEIAWLAGTEGTEVYRRLLPRAAELLEPGRPLVLELGHDQGDAVPELLAADGRWEEPRVDVDFQGLPRVLTVHRSDHGRRHGR